MHIIDSTSDLASYYSLFKHISFSNPVGNVFHEIIINSFLCSLLFPIIHAHACVSAWYFYVSMSWELILFVF